VSLAGAEAAALLQRRELSSEELVAACLERIEEREPLVGAWAFLDGEAALAQARARDAEAPRSPLHGVPVGIKDIFDTADMPTEHGSPIHAGRRPDADATCVRRLREAGAVVLGKTVTTEFATYQPPRTVNPLDPERTPGGSSSGSAAAVADGMVPLALGSQTAGSTIRPASFCGIFGFKPTHGAVDLSGALRLSARLDTIGPMARDAQDVGLLLDALLGAAPAPARADGAPRFALVRTRHWEQADASGRGAVERAAARLEAAGAEVAETALPAPFDGLTAAQETIMAFDLARSLAAERAHHGEQLSEPLRALLAQGDATGEGEYRAAVALAERCRAQVGGVLAGADAILTPAAIGEAPPRDTTGDPVFCRAWTLLGTPAVAVPGLTGESGMPVGIQLVGAPGADRALLAVAAWAAERLGA
jgi:Asp-tRNA(Asn)/Glu-tRNA(Gln) amidotransferase A subunit family amidase